jgi:hypothetical protein
VSFGRKLQRRREKRVATSANIAVKGLKVQCGPHGRTKWRGDVVCGACKRIHLCVAGDFPGLPPNDMCHCGVKLFGGETLNAMSARPACHECAKKLATSQTTPTT